MKAQTFNHLKNKKKRSVTSKMLETETAAYFSFSLSLQCHHKDWLPWRPRMSHYPMDPFSPQLMEGHRFLKELLQCVLALPPCACSASEAILLQSRIGGIKGKEMLRCMIGCMCAHEFVYVGGGGWKKEVYVQGKIENRNTEVRLDVAQHQKGS